MFHPWFRTALFNLLVAASLGAVLRFVFVAEIPGMNFRYVLHAHSHVAMLGWVYMALYACMVTAFLPEEQARSPRYRRLFALTQVAVAGMLLSFPFQGYGPVSIAFSTAHILLSYVFAIRFFRDLPQGTGLLSVRFIRSALWFMAGSTLGIWAMGPVMATGLKSSPLYILVVQFFLHFQFFGWFLFGVLGLFFRGLERQGMAWPVTEGRHFFLTTLGGTLLTFALPLTWWKASVLLFAINGLGVLLVTAAAYLFFRRWGPVRREIFAPLLPDGALLYRVAFAAYLAMALLRLISIVPAVAVMGYTLRNFTIGFLHLFLLGFVSPFLFGYAGGENTSPAPPAGLRWGYRLFLTGMVISEFLLFGQGLLLWAGAHFIPGYYELLFSLSALMPAGVLMILAADFKYPKTSALQATGR